LKQLTLKSETSEKTPAKNTKPSAICQRLFIILVFNLTLPEANYFPSEIKMEENKKTTAGDFFALFFSLDKKLDSKLRGVY